MSEQSIPRRTCSVCGKPGHDHTACPQALRNEVIEECAKVAEDYMKTLYGHSAIKEIGDIIRALKDKP